MNIFQLLLDGGLFFGWWVMCGGRYISGHQPPPFWKTAPPIFCQAPLNLETVQAPPYISNSPLCLVFRETSLKNRIFQSHLLKATEFLVKTLGYDREKHFCFIRFLSLNLSDFTLFFMTKLQPTPYEKSHLLFPTNLPLKIDILSSSPLFEIWQGAQPLPPSAKQKGRGGGVHYESH